MVVKHLISLEKEGNKKAIDAKELHLPYIIQVLNYTLEVLHECQTDTASNDKLNDTVGSLGRCIFHLEYIHLRVCDVAFSWYNGSSSSATC